MAQKLLTAALATLTILVSAATLAAQTPRTISYQGVLADQSGSFLPDGIHSIAVSLYEAPTGGTSILTEVTSTTVVRGVFNVILGSTGGGIPESVSFDRAYFLGVSVDGGAELQPRTAMTSVPYAIRAAVADQANGLAPGATGAVVSLNNRSGAITLQGSGGTSVSTSGNVITIASAQPTTQTTLTLPFKAVTRSSQSPFELIDSSTSVSTPLINLDVRDSVSTRVGFRVRSNAHGQSAIDASTTGGGSVAVFTKSVDRATGTNGTSTFIGPVLVAKSLAGSKVTAAEFSALDTVNTRPAVDIEHRGKGVGLQVDATGGNIAVFRRRRVTGPGSSSTSTVVRFDSTGKGFFDGGTQNGGADVAEAFDVAGDRSNYAPGDVLEISTARGRQVVHSSHRYSTLVVGVYATKPGVLLTEESLDTDISSQVPMGVVGVIPTKVSDENGPIHIGDILVSSSRPGYAMRGDPAIAKDLPGCIIGKALESFDGEGSGLVRVLVNVH